MVDAGSPDRWTWTELRSLTASLFEQRLDRSRPLWRIDVVPELTDGGSALVWRFHHAVADGQTFMRAAWDALWDEGIAGPRPPRRARAVSRPPSERSAAEHRFVHLGAAARQTPHPWHRSPFSGRIDAQREVAFASAPVGRVCDRRPARPAERRSTTRC